MSLVDLHAVGLLAMPLLTCAICLLVPRRQPNSRQLTTATLVAGVTTIAVVSMHAHMCNAGNPFLQCIIGGACIWVVLACIKIRWVKTCIIVVVLGIMNLLSMHFNDLVHGRKWVGNVRHLAVFEYMNDGHLAKIRDEVQTLGNEDEEVYPERWLRALPIGTVMIDAIGEDLPYRVESHRAWHTWFTGLHRVTEVKQDFWYPGGRPYEAAASVIFRDTPDDSVLTSP